MYIHNISGLEKNYGGTPIPNNTFFQIPVNQEVSYSMNDSLISDITSGNVFMSRDGASDINQGVNAQIRYLMGKDGNVDNNGNQLVYVNKATPFADKKVDDKKIFQRIDGAELAVTTENNDTSANYLEFSVPYASCKLTGVEVIGGSLGDKVKLKILDTAVGTVSTIPKHELNIFGGKTSKVNVAKDFYVRESSYDADLFAGLFIKIEYTTVSNKTVYFNFVMHELKD